MCLHGCRPTLCGISSLMVVVVVVVSGVVFLDISVTAVVASQVSTNKIIPPQVVLPICPHPQLLEFPWLWSQFGCDGGRFGGCAFRSIPLLGQSKVC